MADILNRYQRMVLVGFDADRAEDGTGDRAADDRGPQPY
jgi:hypothetical protein